MTVTSPPARGLPLRIALPIIVVFGAVFLGIMAYFLKTGLGSTGTALGTSAGTGDARIATAGAPGNAVGGGPPAPVAQELGALRARLERNPRDADALVSLANLELDAGMYARARVELRRALSVAPRSPDALYGDAVAERGVGNRGAAIAAFRRFLSVAPHDRNAPAARAALRALGAS